MTLIVSAEAGVSVHYRSSKPPAMGRTPLAIERERTVNGAGGGRWLLVQLAMDGGDSIGRRVISEHATERDAELAAAAFADGTAKPPAVRKSKTAKTIAKHSPERHRAHSAIVRRRIC